MKLGILAGVGFQEALARLIKNSVPVLVAFKLKSTARAVSVEYEKYNSIRNDLLKKHANLDKNGNIIADEKKQAIFNENEYDKFLIALQELQEIEVDIPLITSRDLESIKEITVTDLLSLDDLIQT